MEAERHTALETAEILERCVLFTGPYHHIDIGDLF